MADVKRATSKKANSARYVVLSQPVRLIALQSGVTTQFKLNTIFQCDILNQTVNTATNMETARLTRRGLINPFIPKVKKYILPTL